MDYRIDVDRIRCEVRDLVDVDVRLSEPPKIEMVELTGETAVLWISLPAISPLASWTPHNEVRQRLVHFLKDFEDGIYLPRQRYLVASEGAAKPTRNDPRPTRGNGPALRSRSRLERFE